MIVIDLQAQRSNVSQFKRVQCLFINDVWLCVCVISSPTAASFSARSFSGVSDIETPSVVLWSHWEVMTLDLFVACSSRGMLLQDNSILVLDDWVGGFPGLLTCDCKLIVNFVQMMINVPSMLIESVLKDRLTQPSYIYWQ